MPRPALPTASATRVLARHRSPEGFCSLLLLPHPDPGSVLSCPWPSCVKVDLPPLQSPSFSALSWLSRKPVTLELVVWSLEARFYKLSCNSHTSGHFEAHHSVVFHVVTMSCVYHPSSFQDFFITPQENLAPSSNCSPGLPSSPPRQSPISFLYLQVCQFWISHINGIIQYMTFCVWFLSLSVMFLGVHPWCIVCQSFIHFLAE